MKISTTCSECNRIYHIEYDEQDGTLSFCAFCGEEYDDNGEILESLPPSEWGEDQEDGFHL